MSYKKNYNQSKQKLSKNIKLLKSLKMNVIIIWIPGNYQR